MMMNLKGFGRKRSWPNFKVVSWHSSGGMRKTTKNLSQYNRSPGPRFKPGTSQIQSTSVKHSATTFGLRAGVDTG
jgi:hypothetical protein